MQSSAMLLMKARLGMLPIYTQQNPRGMFAQIIEERTAVKNGSSFKENTHRSWACGKEAGEFRNANRRVVFCLGFWCKLPVAGSALFGGCWKTQQPVEKTEQHGR